MLPHDSDLDRSTIHTLDDAELIQRMILSDERAFEIVIARYLPPLTRFAQYMLRSEDASEDLVQQVFVALWERREQLGAIGRLKPYLFRAVRNRVLNHQEFAHVRAQYEQQAIHDMPVAAPSHEQRILTASEIQAAVSRLPDRRQLALRLRLEEDMSHAEIAQVLGMTPVAAQRLVARAIAELREMLRGAV